MKKVMAGVLMSGLVLGAIQAQAATNVYSANVVGYVNVTLPAGGKYIMMGSPFDSITNSETRTLSDVFAPGCGLRTNANRTLVDRVYVWDQGAQQYITVGMRTNGTFAGVNTNPQWTSPAGTNPIIPRGYGLFVQSWTGAVADSTITLSGQVPAVVTNVQAVFGAPGVSSPYQILMNPYPTDVALDSLINTNTGAFGSSDRTLGDRIYLWNTNTQQYITLGLKTPTNRWYYPLTNPQWNTNNMPVITVGVGQSFFYQGKGTNFNWSVVRPYSL